MEVFRCRWILTNFALDLAEQRSKKDDNGQANDDPLRRPLFYFVPDFSLVVGDDRIPSLSAESTWASESLKNPGKFLRLHFLCSHAMYIVQVQEIAQNPITLGHLISPAHFHPRFPRLVFDLIYSSQIPLHLPPLVPDFLPAS